MPFYILYKLTFYLLFLPSYKMKRLAAKLLETPAQDNQPIKKGWAFYLPLAIIGVISIVGLANNLRAEPIRPESYGKDNILYQVTKVGEQYDEDLNEQVTEGPLPDNNTPLSYLEGEALTGDQPADPSAVPDDTLVAIEDDSALAPPDPNGSVLSRRDKIIDYKVEQGDTVSTIAKKFNVSVTTILWENNLSYTSMIKPGQSLRILPVTGLSYKIKKGENLQTIAKTYQGNVDEIIQFNKLASASDIAAGQTIVIPKGVKPVTTYIANVTAPRQSASIAKIFQPPAAPSSAKFLWPTNSKRITQYFKWRHNGLDVGNKVGQPIYASEAGKVEVSGWNKGGYGYYVIINHGGGVKTLYAHASKLYVKAGDTVSRGEVIAAIGSTGRSTGPHLHFEVRVNGSYKNPLSYIR